MKKDIAIISRNNLRILKTTPMLINGVFMITIVSDMFEPVQIPRLSIILVGTPFLCLIAMAQNLGFCILYKSLLLLPFVYLCLAQYRLNEMQGGVMNCLFICLSFMLIISNIGKLIYGWFKG